MDKLLPIVKVEHFNSTSSSTFLLLPSQMEELKERLVAHAIAHSVRLDERVVPFDSWSLDDVKAFASKVAS